MTGTESILLGGVEVMYWTHSYRMHIRSRTTDHNIRITYAYS